MKRWLISLVVVLIALVAAIVWERSGWVAEMNALCQAAQPLVNSVATREQIIERLGQPSVEYTGDEDVIVKHFANEKLKDIRTWAHKRGRLMVYSQSNSIMFLYMNADGGGAAHASCFLQ